MDIALPLLVGSMVAAASLAAALLQARMRPISRRARQLAADHAARDREMAPPVSPQQQLAAWLQRGFEPLGLGGGERGRRLEERLAQAGIRSGEATVLQQAATLVAPLLGAILGYCVAPMLLADPQGSGRLMALVAGAVLGVGVPRLWLSNRISKRQRELSRALPDALDLYVICAEAGLSMDAAMARVARELAPASPPLADELQLTAIELGFLPNRHDAFANLLQRVPLPAFRGLVGMFQQTERYGTPLAEALRQLAADYRTEGLMRAEAKAARLPAVLTVPMILFVLPPLFIILVGPAIIQVLATP